MALQSNLSRQNLTNVTLDDSLDSAFEMSVKLSAIFGILQIVLGVVFNLLLLVAVLGKRELRRDVRNMLIASLAVADLLAAAVLQTTEVSLEMQKNWSLGCYPHIAFQLLRFFAFSFVSAWGLVCLNSLLVARLCRLDMPLTSFLTSAVTTSISVWKRRLDRALVVVVIALPWVSSVIVITPIVFTGLHEFHRTVWTEQKCDFIFVTWALVALNTLFFFLPYLLVFVLLSVSACLACYRRNRRGVGTITASAPPGMGETAVVHDRPRAYLAASVLTFLLMGPRHVLSMLNQYQATPVLADVPLWVIMTYSFQWLSHFKPVCLPLVWLLLLPDVRARARHLLTFAGKTVMGVSDPPRFDPSVSYKNLDP